MDDDLCHMFLTWMFQWSIRYLPIIFYAVIAVTLYWFGICINMENGIIVKYPLSMAGKIKSLV
jgi:hypothetical protein